MLLSRDISSATARQRKYAWYRDLTGYQWFVVAIASLGWMFDTMAQQLFSLARAPALRDLLGNRASPGLLSLQAGYATTVFMVGWALGGVLFGVLGDRLGRAKTMILTILCYTTFTGASLLSHNIWEFNAYRFLCGLGVGGQFAVGVALVTELVPERARPFALGTVQAFSTVGNMIAALTGIVLGQMERSGAIHNAWRYEFLVGALPAPLALVVFTKLKEPEPWLKERAAKKKMGSFGELFSDARWRRNAIVGMLLAFSGVVGVWGIGFFSYDLFRPVLERTFRAQGLTGAELAGKTTTWIGLTSMFQNLGCFLGVYSFTYLTYYIGRKKAFAISLLAAMLATALTFWKLCERSQVFWMIPLMGFTQLSLFGGYAIYLPELFPTRLRSTGTSFCYNVGRLVAAVGPLTLGMLTSQVYHGPNAMRWAGVTMCPVFLVGMAILPFAPETNGKPLPE
jgi:MFS family permease